jgi:hypothetical protein
MTVLERGVIVTIIACGLMSIGLAVAGIPVLGNDAYNHLHWLTQFNELRQDGIAYPRWFGHSWSDFGAPSFYFYPPLAFFIMNAFSVLIAGWTADSYFHLLQTSASIASVFTFWLYLQKSYTGYSRKRQIVASLLYGFLTYRFVNVYIRGAIGEHLALVWLPLLFIAVDMAVDSSNLKRKLRSSYWFALSFVLIFISSVPIIGALSLVLPVYVIFKLRPKLLKAWPLVVGGVLGLGLVAFHALPAAKFGPMILSGMLLGQSLESYVLYNVLFVNQTNLFVLPSVFLIASIIVLIYWWRSKPRGAADIWIVIGAVSVFVQIPYISVPLWDYYPPLRYVQFGTRFDTFLTISMAIAYLTITKPKARTVLLVSIIALNLLTIIKPIKSMRQAFESGPIEKEGQIVQDGFEYFSKYVGENPFAAQRFNVVRYNKPEIAIDTNFTAAPGISILERKSNWTKFAVDLASPQRVLFHRYYWPSWHLRSGSGDEIKIAPGVQGLIEATLPSGKYEAELRIEKTEVERSSAMISLFSVVATLCIGAFAYSKVGRNGKE